MASGPRGAPAGNQLDGDSSSITAQSPGTSCGQISFKLKAFHQFVGDSSTMRSKYGLTQLDPCIIYLT